MVWYGMVWYGMVVVTSYDGAGYSYQRGPGIKQRLGGAVVWYGMVWL